MSADGWVKLWRKMEDSDIWELPPTTTRIWLWILLHASREAHVWHGIHLEPGDLITSYQQIAKGVAWMDGREKVIPSYASVRWAIKMLKSRQALRQEPRQGGLHLKVLHWEEYQGDKRRTTTGTTTGTTTEQRQDNDNVQEVRSKKLKNKPLSPEATVFEFWKETMSKNGNTTFDPARKTAVQRGLKNLTLEEALAAVKGCSLSPHNMGDNDRHQKYNDLTLIFRDAEHWERFIELSKKPAGGHPSHQPFKPPTPEEIAEIEAKADFGGRR